MVAAINADSNIQNKSKLVGPSIATFWKPEDVWNTGFVDSYSSSLAYTSVERLVLFFLVFIVILKFMSAYRYPADNCGAQFGYGTPVNPQDVFPSYLTHQAGQNLVSNYLNSTAYLQTKNKKLLMFETNTASCGGFPGISDSFGAALWGLDYALQLANSNFSGALFHVGGQHVYYNVCVPVHLFCSFFIILIPLHIAIYL
jgi:hypothetical protein